MTSYPDVDELISAFLESVREALSDRLLAVYLEGSLAAGGFDPERSDIDVVVVTTDHLPPEVVSRLTRMHSEMAARPSPWATEFEVTYAPRDGVRRFDPSDARPWPNLERGGGPLRMWRPDFGWTVHLHSLRRHGIVLQGPAPGTLVDPVTPDDLRRIMVRGAREWLPPYIRDPTSLHLGARAFVVLTACRILYTLDTGEIAPKQVAGAWSRERLDRSWSELIDSALAWRKHHSHATSIPMSNTVALVRFVQRRANEWNPPRKT